MIRTVRGRLAIRSVLLGSAVAVSSSLVAAAADESAEKSGPIEKVVVTAQKRNEELRVVPQSVTALSEKTLENQQLNNFTDYAPLVPGMQIETTQPGMARIVLRGINAGGVGSTVGVYLDETPYGSSNALSNGSINTPDLDTFDIKRVEVLRGPQGTLYGSSTLGGLLKFVTNAPDASGFEGKAMVGFDAISDGGVGWTAKGMLNVPLADDLAVRVSGFTRTDAGYIDDPLRGLNDINDTQSFGYRASALYTPTEKFSARLTAISQDINADNNSAVDLVLSSATSIAKPYTPLFGDLNQSHSYDQFNDVKYRQYNGTLDYDFGFATLTSVTSFDTFRQESLVEATNIYGTSLGTDTDLDKFVQEVRLTSPASDKFEWLLGFYYTDEDATFAQELTGIGGLFVDSKFKETAGFANATYYFTPRFDLSLGGRYATNDQEATQGGPLAPATHNTSSEDVFTYAVAPRFRLSDETMIYGRVAKGYRPGGPNVIPPAAPPGTPTSYGADNLTNYEAGVKTDLTDRLSVDLSVFFIDWSDIQLLNVVNGYGINDNGGSAESKGFEWTITYVPIDGLNVLFTGAYTDAELTEDTSIFVGGLKGDALPFSAKWQTALSADYSYALPDDVIGTLGVTWAYVGDRLENFDTTFGRLELPSYNTVDLRAGLDFDVWTVQLFAKNVGDERGIQSFQTSYAPLPPPTAFGVGGRSATVITPRTIGMTATVRF